MALEEESWLVGLGAQVVVFHWAKAAEVEGVSSGDHLAVLH